MIKQLRYDVVDDLAFISWMYLNNLNMVHDDLFNFPSVNNVDIIIDTPFGPTPDELIASRINLLCTTFQKKVNDSNKRYLMEQLKFLKEREKEINAEFKKVQSFSLANDEKKIIILAKKEI